MRTMSRLKLEIGRRRGVTERRSEDAEVGQRIRCVYREIREKETPRLRHSMRGKTPMQVCRFPLDALLDRDEAGLSKVRRNRRFMLSYKEQRAR